MSDFVQQGTKCCFDNDDSWVILSPIEQQIKKKIEAVGTPLRDWDISIYRGILTGYNDAFIIDGKKKDELIAEDPKSAEIIRPILRGRDIKKYSYEDHDLWLIATLPSMHYDIEDYTAVKKYLLSFGIERLEQTGKEYVINGSKVKARKKTHNKWFETQDSIAYWEDFSRQKIVWARLTRISKSDFSAFPRFALVPEGYYIVDSLCFFTGENLDLLVKMLNSKFAAYYFFNSVAILDNGGLQMRQQYVENILLPKISNADINNIDKLIFEAFGFTSEEIEYIDTFLLSKEHEISSISCR